MPATWHVLTVEVHLTLEMESGADWCISPLVNLDTVPANYGLQKPSKMCRFEPQVCWNKAPKHGQSEGLLRVLVTYGKEQRKRGMELLLTGGGGKGRGTIGQGGGDSRERLCSLSLE